jgi:hypothetical protein
VRLVAVGLDDDAVRRPHEVDAAAGDVALGDGRRQAVPPADAQEAIFERQLRRPEVRQQLAKRARPPPLEHGEHRREMEQAAKLGFASRPREVVRSNGMGEVDERPRR